MREELLTTDDIAEYAPEGWNATTGRGGVRFEPEEGADVYVEVADGFTDPVHIAARVANEDDGPDRLVDHPKSVMPFRNEAFEDGINQKFGVAKQEIRKQSTNE